LRDHGTGTVSGTGLYEVAGFVPLAVAGCLEVGKGAVGPFLAGRSRPVLSAVAAGAAVVGHNWSPFLKGKGGRGISPSLGATLVLAPEGTAVLISGLAGGRIAKKTGFGSFLSLVAIVPVLALTRGKAGAVTGACIAVPMLAKRLLGNEPLRSSWLNRRWRRKTSSRTVLVNRLVFDRDERSPAG